MLTRHRTNGIILRGMLTCQPATRLCEAIFAVLLVLMIVASAAAGPFSQLVIFGDSLSDVGNIAQATGGIYPGR
jgi:phospholipase/lecithinase/hemolysin